MAGIKRLLLLLSVTVLPVISAFKTSAQVISARQVLHTCFDSIDKVRTLYYRLEYRERTAGRNKMRHDSSTVKYQKYPLRIYMKMANGAELLWGPNMNSGNVLVHPNAFPYFNLSLNPNGYWMRKNQHHGIDEVGFAYFERLLKAAIKRAGQNFSSQFFYQGMVHYGLFNCYHLLMIDPGFKYVPYTVQPKETILTIAHKLCLNEYMILKHNPNINSYTDVKAGQTILIPSNYAMTINLYIDKHTMLPVMICADDDKGLFEEYDFKELKVNPPFKSEEFSRHYKGYHF